MVFLALCRQPVMHSPHSMQPVRSGPTPPKNGSGLVTPGPSPKYTPTGVSRKVCPTPISSATAFMTRSAGVIVGLSTTPSMRVAWS